MERRPLAAGVSRLGTAAAALALVGVACGAFGAHALRARLGPEPLAVWETAARYQLIHALAALASAWLLDRTEARAAGVAGWLFVAGVVLFSGSLYGLATLGARWLGFVTPLGGLCFVAGWLALALAFQRR